MYQHRDNSIEIRVPVQPGRSECAGTTASSLLKCSDFPKFEQSQHTSANTVKEGEDVFSHNKSEEQTLSCTFALARSPNIHEHLTFITFRVNASKASREVLH